MELLSKVEPAMDCMRMVVEDMYLGLGDRTSASWDDFAQAAVTYIGSKFYLDDRQENDFSVEEETYHLIKKCAYHWIVGVCLALHCAGVSESCVQHLVAVGCRRALTGFSVEAESVSLRYRRETSQSVRNQYATGKIPSDDWCAWLELEAVKTAALALVCDRKENYDEK